MKGLLTLLLVWIFAGSALAQVNIDPLSNARPAGPGTDRIEGFLGSPGAEIAPDASQFKYLDDAGRAALTASLTAYYRYRTSGFEHRRRVFDWQYRSSQIIFAVVILLVSIGVYFSWLQFMAAARMPRTPEAVKVTKATEPDEDRQAGLRTTIEASLQGIKVSSPVLGVVILVISLAFFYLYLVHVYPINEVF